MRRTILYLMLTASLYADVTIRYQTTLNAPAPASTGGIAAPDAIRIKGHMGHVTSGGFTMIVDFNGQRLTFLDTWHAKYATIPAAEYSSRISAILPAGTAAAMEAALGNIKSKVETKITGREETIQGVRAVEREVRISVAEPARMTMVMQIWTAKPGEALRLPAIRELAAMNLFERYVLNPAAVLPVPAGGDGLTALTAEMEKDQSVVLRTQVTMSMTDAGAEAIEYRQEAMEISTASVDAAIFQIPADYTAAPLDEVVLGATRGRLPEMTLMGPAGSDLPAPGVIQAYVPQLNPLHRVEPELASAPRVSGQVRLLVTVDPRGGVAKAEALSGPDELRTAAEAAVKQWRFHPVIRNGQAVFAYTDVSTLFGTPGAGDINLAAVSAESAAAQRFSALAQSMPRSPAQVLEDLEHDSEGDADRRFYALERIAQAALAANEDAKAEATARELLESAAKRSRDWNYGNAIHTGHSVLGLVALRTGEIAAARNELLAAGKTPGSPQLNSFGPDVALAKALLDRGERDVVLEYFAECRSFWTMGALQLDRWSEAVRRGAMPVFGTNLRR